MKSCLGWLWFWLVAAVAALALWSHSGPPPATEAPAIEGKATPGEKIDP